MKYNEMKIEDIFAEAHNGDADAQEYLGECFIFGNDEIKINYSKGLEFFSKAAAQGHPIANYNLGQAYRLGVGVERNEWMAFDYYKKAAEQGQAEAQYMLGACFAKGEGVFQNDGFAFEWYTKAAEQGLFEAQNKLVECYRQGKGTVISKEKAYEWAIKADNNANKPKGFWSKKFFLFKGTIKRLKYFICLILISFLCYFFEEHLPSSISLFLDFFLFALMLSLSVRRLHDIGHSGWHLLWMCLIPFSGLFLIFMPSKIINNKYRQPDQDEFFLRTS